MCGSEFRTRRGCSLRDWVQPITQKFEAHPRSSLRTRSSEIYCSDDCKKKVAGSSPMEGGLFSSTWRCPGSEGGLGVHASGNSLVLRHGCLSAYPGRTHGIQVPEGDTLPPEIQKTNSSALSFVDQLSVAPTT